MPQNTPQVEEADFIWKQLIKLSTVTQLYLHDEDLPGQNGGPIHSLKPAVGKGYPLVVANLAGDAQELVYTEFDIVHSEVVERDGKNFLVVDFRKATQAARDHVGMNESTESMLYDLVWKHLDKSRKVALMGRRGPQEIATIRPLSAEVRPAHVNKWNPTYFYPIVFKDGTIYTIDDHEFDALEVDFDGDTMLLVPPALKKVQESDGETPMVITLAQRHLDKGQRLYLTYKLGERTDINKVTDINIYTFDGKVEFFLHEPAIWVKVSAAEAEKLDVDFEEDRMILTPASIRRGGSSTRVTAPVKEDLNDPMLFDLVQKWLKEQKPVFLRSADGEFLIRNAQKVGHDAGMGLYRFDTWQRAWRCTADTLERCIVDNRKDGTRVIVTPGSLRESMEEGILMHLMKKHAKNGTLSVNTVSSGNTSNLIVSRSDLFIADSDTQFRVVDDESGVVETFNLSDFAPFNHTTRDKVSYEFEQDSATNGGRVWLKITFYYR